MLEDLLSAVLGTLRTRQTRWGWLVVAAVTVLVVLLEYRFVPVAWDIVTYAQSYARGHVEAYGWSYDKYTLFVSESYLLNFGPLVALGLAPMLLTWLLIKAAYWRYLTG